MPCNPLKCQCGNAFFPQRYVMVLLISFGTIITFVQRESFGIIVAHLSISMTNITNLTSSACGGDFHNEIKESLNEWDLLAQSLLFGSFFIGYVLMMLPGGYISDKLGGRLVFIVAVFASSTFTVLFPFIVRYTFFWLICMGRAIIGGSCACIITSSATLISRWIPKYEWATVAGAVFSCNALSMIFVHVNFVITESSIGWTPLSFIWGGIGLIWCIFGLLWLFSSPNDHPSMTSRERSFLDEELKRRIELPLDWVAIFLDPAVWGLVAAQVGHAYLFYTLATNLTSYYIYALNVSLSKHIIFILVPYPVIWMLAVLIGLLADFLVHSKGVKPVLMRKIYYAIATIIPAMFIIGMPFAECDTLSVMLPAVFGIAFLSPFFCSIRVNILEITYNYPGFVTGAVCLCGAFITVIVPFTLNIISGENTFSNWKVIAYIIAGNAVLNTIIYSILGSSKRRLWDMTPEERQFYRDQKLKEDEARKSGARN